MEKSKMTQKEGFARIKEVLIEVGGYDDLVEFVEGREAQLVKKAGKQAAAAEANDELAEKVFDILVGQEAPIGIQEILAEGDFDAGITPQKIAVLLTKLIRADRVEKDSDGKRKVYKVKNVD